MAQFVVYGAGPTGSMLNALGKTKQTMICNISAGVINILLNIPFVLYLGVVGVAMSTAISLIIRNLMTLFFIRKNLGYLPYSLIFIKISIIPLLSIFPLYYLSVNSLWNLALLSIISLILSTISIYFVYKIKFFNSEEIENFKLLYNKIRHRLMKIR